MGNQGDDDDDDDVDETQQGSFKRTRTKLMNQENRDAQAPFRLIAFKFKSNMGYPNSAKRIPVTQRSTTKHRQVSNRFLTTYLLTLSLSHVSHPLGISKFCTHLSPLLSHIDSHPCIIPRRGWGSVPKRRGRGGGRE